MLDIGWSELVIIGVVALVVVGPKELPTLLRTAGQWVGKARRMASEFQGQLNDAIREAELEDVKKSVDDLRSLSPTRLIGDHLASIGDEVKSAVTTSEAQLASIASDPVFSTPVTAETTDAVAGEAVAAEVAPAVSESEAVAMIDAAAPQITEPGEPVFDLTPAPGPATAVAALDEPADEKAPGA